jgi:hypothetical protein
MRESMIHDNETPITEMMAVFLKLTQSNFDGKKYRFITFLIIKPCFKRKQISVNKGEERQHRPMWDTFPYIFHYYNSPLFSRIIQYALHKNEKTKQK